MIQKPSHLCIVRIQQLTTTFSGKGPELQGQFAGSLHWALCLQEWVPKSLADTLDLKWRGDVDWKVRVSRILVQSWNRWRYLKTMAILQYIGNYLTFILTGFHQWFVDFVCSQTRFLAQLNFLYTYTIVELRTEQWGNTEGHPLRSSIPQNRPSIPSIRRGSAILGWICVAGAITCFVQKVPDIEHLLFWYLWNSIDLNYSWKQLGFLKDDEVKPTNTENTLHIFFW